MTQTATQQKTLFSWSVPVFWKSPLSCLLFGDRVRRRCTSEEQENSPSSEGIVPIEAITRGRLQQTNDRRRLQQRPSTVLSSVNRSQQHGEEFAPATTFPELFRLLDTKGTSGGHRNA